jgi:hypothetical protein
MDYKTLYQVLHRAYLQPFSLASNYCRHHIQEVAALASMGLLTTQVSPTSYGRQWRITPEGIETLHIEGYL